MSVLSLAYGLAALPLALATPQRYGTWGNGRGMADDFEITTTASSSSAAASDPVMSILPVNDAVVPSNNELPEEDAAVNDPATVVVPPSGNATAVSGGSPTVAAAAADDTVKAQFAASTTWDFAGLTTLPSGLAPADYPIADAVPTPRVFDPANVYVEDGSLVLKVQAYSGSGPISCGEIATTFNISYGSIRTWAVLTEVPGVVNGETYRSTNKAESEQKLTVCRYLPVQQLRRHRSSGGEQDCKVIRLQRTLTLRVCRRTLNSSRMRQPSRTRTPALRTARSSTPTRMSAANTTREP